MMLAFAFLITMGGNNSIYAALLPQEDNDATLQVVNESDMTVCYVNISPTIADDWGDDWLNAEEAILPGESRSFDVVAGDYDVRLVDCDDNELLTKWNLAITDQYELHFITPAPCESLSQEGVIFYQQAQYRDAIKQFQEALTCYRQSGDRSGEGICLNNIGVNYDSLGEYEEALEYYQQALVIDRDVGNQPEEATALNNIGVTYHSLGEYNSPFAEIRI
jgi:tetratricopeptide (TPR) repeat protein